MFSEEFVQGLASKYAGNEKHYSPLDVIQEKGVEGKFIYVVVYGTICESSATLEELKAQEEQEDYSMDRNEKPKLMYSKGEIACLSNIEPKF